MRAVLVILLISFLAWLVTYTLDCYFISGGVQRPSRPPSAPLSPGDQPNNLFWFLHVSADADDCKL